MKKAATIIYRVSSILSYIAFGSLLGLGFIFTLVGAVLAGNGFASNYSQTIAAGTSLLSVGLTFVLIAPLFLVAAILSKKARNCLNKGLKDNGIHIANIVFGAICQMPSMVVAAIFSFIVIGRSESDVIEVE